MLDTHEVGLEGRLNGGVDVCFQDGLVAFDLQQIFGPGIADRARNVLLAPQGINRYQRSVQFQQLEQLGDGGNLVGLVFDGDLPQGQRVSPNPGAHQVQAGAAQATAPAQGLTIDLDVLDPQVGTDGVDPGGETVLEGRGGQVAEDIAKGIVGRDALRQSQAQRAQPGFLGAAEGGDVFKALGPGQGGAQG